MTANMSTAVPIDEINRLSKGVSGYNENSRKALFDMCKSINASFTSLPLDSKIPVLNIFVHSFLKFSNRMTLFNAADSLEILQTSISILASFATSQEPVSQLHELVFFDLISKLFSLLCKLVETTRQVPKNITSPLLTSKAYIFIGLPSYQLKMPDDVVSFHEVVNESRPGASSGAAKKVRSLCLDPILASLENMRLSSSSSSSSTTGESASEKSALVRRNALNFLCLLLQNAPPSSVITAWPVLLSTTNTASWTASSSTNHHESWFILSMMLHDQSMLVRYMACSVVIELVDESVKAFLAVAQENSIGVPSSSAPISSAGPSSFTSYSAQLAAHLREIHRCLITAALHANSGQDKCPQMVVHVMKALQFLVRITPYHRLRPGLLTDVFKVSSSLLRSKDVDVRVACLTIFGEILANSNAHCLLEMECLVRSCKPPAFSRPLSYCNSPTGSISGAETPILTNNGIEEGFQPWLLKIAMESAAPNSVYSYPVKIESLQLLNALIKFYSKTLFFEAKQLPELFKFIYATMYAADPVYLAHACFALETIGNQLNEESISTQLPLNEICLFWSDTLSNHIFRLLQAPHANQQGATLKAALLDALSSIGPLVFDRLPANLRILCTTIPVDFSDSAQVVDKTLRASAIRCLGHLVGFKSMQKDRAFVQSCIDISLCHARSEPACQCAAAWLLRNAVDVPLSSSTTTTEDHLVSDKKLEEILLSSVNLTLKGPDKAKPHSMTVIWRILISKPNAVSRDLASLAVEDVICPVLSGKVKGPVKLQWNAADGLSEAFSCETFLSSSSSPVEQLLPRLVDSTCSAMVQSLNFRTRTTLANALRSFAAIRTGPFAKQCLTAYFEAFTSARETIKSPSEFKHVDALVTALWLGFITWLAKICDDSILAGWLGAINPESLENVLRDIKTSLISDEQMTELAHLAVEKLGKLEKSHPLGNDNVKLLAEAITSGCLTTATLQTES